MRRGALIAAVGLGASAVSAFAAAPVGSAKHPVPLHHAAAVGGGWFLRINKVNWNAAHLIARVPDQYGQEPPAAAREVMLTVVIAYRGGGQADMIDFARRVYAIGSHKTPYLWDSGLNACGPGEAKLPKPDAQEKVGIGGSFLFSGTVVRGHICVEVARNDVRTLRLYVEAPQSGLVTKPAKRHWFALR